MRVVVGSIRTYRESNPDNARNLVVYPPGFVSLYPPGYTNS
jgi:hypothetical protein